MLRACESATCALSANLGIHGPPSPNSNAQTTTWPNRQLLAPVTALQGKPMASLLYKYANGEATCFCRQLLGLLCFIEGHVSNVDFVSLCRIRSSCPMIWGAPWTGRPAWCCTRSSSAPPASCATCLAASTSSSSHTVPAKPSSSKIATPKQNILKNATSDRVPQQQQLLDIRFSDFTISRSRAADTLLRCIQCSIYGPRRWQPEH